MAGGGEETFSKKEAGNSVSSQGTAWTREERENEAHWPHRSVAQVSEHTAGESGMWSGWRGRQSQSIGWGAGQVTRF